MGDGVPTVGLAQPNAAAPALDNHANSACSASAVLGSIKDVLGESAALCAGLGGPSGIAMAIVSVSAAVSALAIRATVVRHGRPVPVDMRTPAQRVLRR